jgi:hypothetical protein
MIEGFNVICLHVGESKEENAPITGLQHSPTPLVVEAVAVYIGDI